MKSCYGQKEEHRIIIIIIRESIYEDSKNLSRILKISYIFLRSVALIENIFRWLSKVTSVKKIKIRIISQLLPYTPSLPLQGDSSCNLWQDFSI